VVVTWLSTSRSDRRVFGKGVAGEVVRALVEVEAEPFEEHDRYVDPLSQRHGSMKLCPRTVRKSRYAE
jgi:hypothetical protein